MGSDNELTDDGGGCELRLSWYIGGKAGHFSGQGHEAWMGAASRVSMVPHQRIQFSINIIYVTHDKNNSSQLWLLMDRIE